MNPTDDPLLSFVKVLRESAVAARLHKVVLAKYRGPEADLQRINLRCVDLKGLPHLQFVYRHSTRDVTRNLPLAEGIELVQRLLTDRHFRNAHLHDSLGSHELTVTERGQARLRHQALAEPLPAPASDAHNREKQRMLSMDRPFLTALGVTTVGHALVPSMARKWKQINKFIEVFASALAGSRLADSKALNIVDFGSGKGYLTFAIHDWLRQVKGVDARVTGVELRPDMVSLCNQVIERLDLQGLRIEQGDVRSWTPAALNVMIALHACDTATDYAIDLGLRGGADIILCSPCCHKQIRPQLLSPHPLRPILQHGVHLGQEAEMLTDGLRALLLEAAGYDTQVFEFVSLEHTNKNKMILAVKRAQPRAAEPVLAQIAEIKAFYGIREQALETLLMERLQRPAPVVTDNPI